MLNVKSTTIETLYQCLRQVCGWWVWAIFEQQVSNSTENLHFFQFCQPLLVIRLKRKSFNSPACGKNRCNLHLKLCKSYHWSTHRFEHYKYSAMLHSAKCYNCSISQAYTNEYSKNWVCWCLLILTNFEKLAQQKPLECADAAACRWYHICRLCMPAETSNSRRLRNRTSMVKDTLWLTNRLRNWHRTHRKRPPRRLFAHQTVHAPQCNGCYSSHVQYSFLLRTVKSFLTSCLKYLQMKENVKRSEYYEICSIFNLKDYFYAKLSPNF